MHAHDQRAAVILAGGKATRLGPLAVQLNKCLMTVGQQPMVVQQINTLRDAGVARFVVVVNEQSRDAVWDVLTQAYGMGVHWDVVEQQGGHSPIDAWTDGLERLLGDGHTGASYVIAADTLVNRIPDDPGFKAWAHTVTYDGAAGDRSWCMVEANGTWADRPAYTGEVIYTGLAYVPSSIDAYRVLAPMRVVGDGSTAHALNLLHARQVIDDIGWLDVGDLDALARARRSRYVTRASNNLQLDDCGIVWKKSTDPAFVKECWFMKEFLALQPYEVRTLFPRVFDGGHGVYGTEYGTEHVDEPTLSELWLYWPASVGMWEDILTQLVTRMQPLWQCTSGHAAPAYVNKMWNRFDMLQCNDRWDKLTYEDELRINGRQYVAGHRLMHALADRAGTMELDDNAVLGTAHGDLSFMNILWSITTGQPKLVDPSPMGDVRYDLAKLRYSYHGGISAILHGLYDVRLDELRIFSPAHDTTPLDEILASVGVRMDEIKMLEALTCLAAPPLHVDDPREALALYLRGVQLGNALL